MSTTERGDRAPGLRTAVVIPAGPRDDLVDTLDSVLRYVDRPRLIVVVDDTGRRHRAATLVPGDVAGDEIAVVAADPSAPGGLGGLWVKLCQGFRVVQEAGPWDVVLRMDADALLIGPGLAAMAADRFADDHGIGVLGSFRVGPDGRRRDWRPAAKRLRSETGLRGLRRPPVRRCVRELVRLGAAHGYEAGAHPLGGAYLLAPRLLDAWSGLGWLSLQPLARSRLGEDHICGLLTSAAGFRTVDMGGPADPIAVTWRGLPAPPAELLARKKLVVHSVRSYRESSEPAVRREFRAARHAGRRE